MKENKTFIRLAVNENCYGCSPHIMAAIRQKYKEVHLYPENNPVIFKERLANKFGVKPENILVGAGSVRIIDGLIETFTGIENEVLTFEKSFIAYTQLSAIHQRSCRFAPLTDFRCDPENLLPFINHRTNLIFIANPNNPTGTIILHRELESFLNNIPKKIIVAVDEAYCEYVTDPLFPDSLALQKKYPNLVIIRSFSKIYGLAGLRIGYAIMEESIASRMAANQIPFSLNYLSSVAALAALEDEKFVRKSSKVNAIQREYLFHELRRLGYNVIPSQANFLYVVFNDEAYKKMMFDTLLTNGIIVCDMRGFGIEKSLRITVGDKEANQRIVEYLA